MSARKIGLLILLLAFGGAMEAAWSVRRDLHFGPEGCRVLGGRFDGPSYTFEQALERPVGKAPQVEVRNAFGGVRVSAGAPGVVKAHLRKVVYLPTEAKARAFSERIELLLSADGAVARVGTNRDAISRLEDVGFETHLEIEVPADSVVTVRNEHGRVDLADVAGGRIESSFDEVTAQRLARDLEVDGRHGEVTVDTLGGSLKLSAQHGNVSVRDVKGRGKLDVQHGDLTALRTGPLEISQQHGSVDAAAVAGDLVVRAGHAQVKARDVLSRADVETSFAGVELLRIGGPARARVEHGQVTAEDVGGGVTVETSYENVRLERVAGPVTITVHHGGLEGKGLAQGARVRASGADVTLDGFTGPVEVELDRGNARVSPRATIAAPITVSVQNGDAQLELPQGSRVDLEGDSRRGEIHSELPDAVVSRDERADHGPGHRLSARLGGGGIAVRVNAEGDVRLSSQTASAIAERSVAKPDLGPAAAAVAAEGQPSPGPEKTPAEAPATGSRESPRERR